MDGEKWDADFIMVISTNSGASLAIALRVTISHESTGKVGTRNIRMTVGGIYTKSLGYFHAVIVKDQGFCIVSIKNLLTHNHLSEIVKIFTSDGVGINSISKLACVD